jgi:hypothetical protein
MAFGTEPSNRPPIYQEYPKWIVGPEVIVQNAAEERCIRQRWARDIGRAKANALQRSRADALALELAPTPADTGAVTPGNTVDSEANAPACLSDPGFVAPACQIRREAGEAKQRPTSPCDPM